jgi:hypothetical protein
MQPADESTQPEREAGTRQSKKPYRAPRLTVYGTLRQLTLAKGGNRADGPGAPQSKT